MMVVKPVAYASSSSTLAYIDALIAVPYTIEAFDCRQGLPSFKGPCPDLRLYAAAVKVLPKQG
jgi:hypothetical protein